MFYVTVYLLSVLLALSVRLEQHKNYVTPATVILFAISAFRYDVGCDWGNYELNYFQQQNQTLQEALISHNPAHWVTLEIIIQLGLDYYWLNIVTSAIFFSGIRSLAMRSPSPLMLLALAFPILILNMPMSAVKQAAAMGLVAHATVAFFDKRPLFFISCVTLGTLYHGSASIALLLAPFWGKGLDTKRVTLGLALLVPIAIMVGATDSAEIATTRYIGTQIESGGGVFRVALVAIAAAWFLIYLRKPWRMLSPQTYKFVILAAFIMISMPAIVPVSTVIADRLSYYLMLPQLFIFSWAHGYSLVAEAPIYKYIPIIATTTIFTFWIMLSQHFQWCYAPYQTIFLK